MNRKEKLYNKEQLVLNIEKDLNLRIWIGYNGTVGEDKIYPPNSVWMRLDNYNQYSVPLSKETNYTRSKTIEKLETFNFPSPIEKLDKILEITKDLKETTLKPW